MRNDVSVPWAPHGLRKRIALLGADGTRARLERHALAEIGCTITDFDCAQALACAMQVEPHDAIVVAFNDPFQDPREVVQLLRTAGAQAVPMLLLLQPEHLGRCAVLFEDPGISFALMPCDTEELVVRVARAVDVVKAAVHCPLSFGRYRFIPQTHTAIVDGALVRLSPKEFGLALYLFRHIDHFQHREAIFDAVWGHRPDRAKARTMDMHITNLRRKLGLCQENGLKLSSARCFGYGLFRSGHEEPDQVPSARDAVDVVRSSVRPAAPRALEFA